MSPIDRLRALIQIPTVSRSDEATTEWHHFQRFVDALAELYPLVHSTLERELIDGYSLLYRWPGAAEGDPSVLMAHYDVVAADDAGWEHPPFAADLVGSGDDQVIWGRGTLDDKGALVAILEAVESRIAAGHAPAHDLYLSFGHNEETAGSGARAVVATLAGRGIRPAFVLDEGGAIVENVFPGVSQPIAVVGVSEKGIASVVLTVAQQGGHASSPPRFTATDRLARAIVRLGRRPFPARLGSVNRAMIATLGRHSRQPYRAAFTNLWLTRLPLLMLFSRRSDETNAMIRTTRVVTQLSASTAANALAESASATINLRIAAGSSVSSAVEHLRRAIRDPHVRLTVLHPSEPSPVSPAAGPAWKLIASAVSAVYPGTIVAPYVMLAASDSRHFVAISDNVYRFTPFEMSARERGTLHAVNERMRVKTFMTGIAFYERIVGAL